MERAVKHYTYEAVACLWGCADGNGVDPRLVFRDRADALEAAAELGLTVLALYVASPEVVPDTKPTVI